jgi:hypothetical protein
LVQKQKSKHVVDIAGAAKKLRQAWFFSQWLERASEEMADPEHLEFHFSACLTAAQSAYYVLDETGGATFKRVQKRWRSRLLEAQRSDFGKMIGLRDDDVHRGSTGAEPLPKVIAERPTAQQMFFGADEVVEMENPDGTKAKGSALRGALGLYIEQQGRRVEATVACREFIEDLRSLLEEMKATAP